jgi:hypothetical protein
MQGINVFATTTARNAAITAPAEGQFAFTKDTNSLWYYDGAAWVASGATGDIEGVTAGVGISGGGTSGTVTITNDMATTITASGDIVVGTGSGTYDNLPIGTTGQVLTADTTVSPYKVKWAAPTSGSTFATDISVNGLTVGKGTASVATNTTLGVDGLLAVTTGSRNTAIGHSAGKAITTAGSNVLVGTDAGKAITTGGNNTIIGEGAGVLLTNGTSNVVVGHDLLNSAVTGVFGNTVLGEGCAISMTSGYYNVAIGQTCLESQTSANYNVAIGNNAGTGGLGGANNIYIGNTISSSSGADVVNIGSGTGNASATYTNVTNIGNGAQASSSSASNTITLGNSSVTALRCQVTSITSLSDERDKTNIEPLEFGLDFVKELKPVAFEWNTRPQTMVNEDGTERVLTGKVGVADIGFIAQDIVALEDSVGAADLLQLSYRDNLEKLEVTQGRLIPILVKAIQDLTAKVEALENAGN